MWRSGVTVSPNLRSDTKAGRAFPRMDSTGPVITSALFSLSVTVYQLTVAQKYSLLDHRRRRQGSTHALGKSNPEGGTPTFLTHSIFCGKGGRKTEPFPVMLTKL